MEASKVKIGSIIRCKSDNTNWVGCLKEAGGEVGIFNEQSSFCGWGKTSFKDIVKDFSEISWKFFLINGSQEEEIIYSAFKGRVIKD